MPKFDSNSDLTRRRLLQLSAATAATLAMPRLAAAALPAETAEHKLYLSTLQSWCDGMIAHQITNADPALNGGLLCPACAMIHGRCGDAVYPLLRVAHTTDHAKYLHAALAVHEWSERNVSREDGSWVNDVTLSTWKGITVFKTIALCEAVLHHGAILPAATRAAWTARIARAAKFLDGFISLQTGNINYPITSTLAFALCAQVLDEPRYLDRAKKLAHEALGNFTPAGLLFGEGHPFDITSPKGCHPVDLGYNVEESLPALALYATLTKDQEVLDAVIKSLRTHLEFMLPDGGWDNSWGTRNYKWSYWGSRTSDGCQTAFVLLADQDSRFREAAYRNLKLMAACTHNNLLYGGPDYFAHGDQPCIHHAFTHAKALATVLDRGTFPVSPSVPTWLPRDGEHRNGKPYEVLSYPEIATHLLSVDSWQATISAYDFVYTEQVQATNKSAGGGHATGGALTLLYHQQLGPIIAASMTEYQIIEISNQQQFIDKPHMCTTPRIECAMEGKTYTSLNDLNASVEVVSREGLPPKFIAKGRLLNTSGQGVPGGDVHYELTYNIIAEVEIVARISSGAAHSAKLIVPVISPSSEKLDAGDAAPESDPQWVHIHKNNGMLSLQTTAKPGFDQLLIERTFNLVPGFECLPFSISLQSGQEASVTLGLAEIL